MDYVHGLMDFIQGSPTAFHAVENIKAMLAKNGYFELNECDRWRLALGGKHFVTRNLSSIIAFRLPDTLLDHFQIVASHSDSPCFKLKPTASRQANGYATLNVEKYGGMIMTSWFDRPLSIAGRMIVRTEEGFEARLLYIDRNLAMIPNMPIHFNREVNDGVKLNPQVDMLPVFGEAGAEFMPLIADELDVDVNAIVGCDLFLVNRDKPALWGSDDAFITAPRLDDLECAYASACAFMAARPSGHVDMMCVFDNEEVGSGTKQGADSTFLEETVRRIASAFPEQHLEAMLSRSFMLSADNAHAVHPNHPEKYDVENRVKLNGGVVVKFNANQKYTSDGVSQAVFEDICAQAGVPVQRFANRSDIPGGSTLGNIANTHVSMNSVDIGLAQLAMHSANESAGAKDIGYMIEAMKRFHQTEIDVMRDGAIRFAQRH